MAGGTLRFAVNEPRTVPFDATDQDSLIVVDTLFDGLTAWARNLTVVPAAATAWESPDAGRTWIFHLRLGATFHDGTEVTARDFTSTWELAAREGAAGFHLDLVEGYQAVREGTADHLAGARVIDTHTLMVRLTEPYSRFPAVVAHPALAPVPRTLWAEDEAAFRRKPVGNGPFMAAEAVVPGGFLRVQRFEEWQNGEPAQLDEVLFQFMDPDNAFVAFQQGRIQVSPLPDGAYELALRRYGRAQLGYRGTGVIDGDTPTLYFLGFDVTRPPFDEPEVRRAVSLAVDRDAIARSVLGGNATPADALVSPLLSGGRGSCESCEHDPERAADIFAAHGVDTITLWFNNDGGHRTVAERVRSDLLAAGIRRVSFRAPPFDDMLASLQRGGPGLFRFGWRPEYPIVDDVLYPLFHSSQIPAATTSASATPTPEPTAGVEPTAGPEPTAGASQGATAEPSGTGTPGGTGGAQAATGTATGRNYMRYSDPDVDQLLEEARAERSAIRRVYLERQAEDLIVNRDQAVVPILFFRHDRVVAQQVVGFLMNPMGLVELHRVLLRREPPTEGPVPSAPGPA